MTQMLPKRHTQDLRNQEPDYLIFSEKTKVEIRLSAALFTSG